MSAKMSEAGGIDLLVIYNSGRFRMGGRGSLSGMMPYGDANAIVMDMAREVLPVVEHTPVLAGVCGTDPFRVMKLFLRDVAAAGFSGVQNFPTVGLIDGQFRQSLEETGMGFGLEVDMIRQAHEMDLLTTPYAFNVEEAEAMAEGRRRHPDSAHGPDDQGHDRRDDGAYARRIGAAHSGHARRGQADQPRDPRAVPRRARSPSRPTPSTFSTTPRASSASTAPARWSDCRSNRRSPSRVREFTRTASFELGFDSWHGSRRAASQSSETNRRRSVRRASSTPSGQGSIGAPVCLGRKPRQPSLTGQADTDAAAFIRSTIRSPHTAP